jgi:RNA polymerase sigma factor (sigma-70 family)
MAEDESPAKQNLRLAVALLDNDERAIEKILRLYGPDILDTLHNKYTKRMGVLRYEDIEDVVSVALGRLWDARADYDDSKGPLRAWFYRIADNLAMDVRKHGWYKARRLERNVGQDHIQEAAGVPPVSQEPQDRDAKRKQSKEESDIQLVLSKLPEAQRTIVMADSASRDGQASNELLADELGIPAAHVRSYRPRAYATIRREMRKLGHEIPEPRKGNS